MKNKLLGILLALISGLSMGYIIKDILTKKSYEKSYYDLADITNLADSLDMDKRTLKPIIEDGDIDEIISLVPDYDMLKCLSNN